MLCARSVAHTQRVLEQGRFNKPTTMQTACTAESGRNVRFHTWSILIFYTIIRSTLPPIIQIGCLQFPNSKGLGKKKTKRKDFRLVFCFLLIPPSIIFAILSSRNPETGGVGHYVGRLFSTPFTTVPAFVFSARRGYSAFLSRRLASSCAYPRRKAVSAFQSTP